MQVDGQGRAQSSQTASFKLELPLRVVSSPKQQMALLYLIGTQGICHGILVFHFF